MIDEIRLLAQFGLGGVLAGLMFYFYRRDRQDSEKRYERLAVGFRQIVEDNTAALTSLKDYLRKNGFKRETD